MAEKKLKKLCSVTLVVSDSLRPCGLFATLWTLCDPVDWRLSGSSVHGILQGTILDGVAMCSFRGFSWPRDRTCVSCISCIGRWILYHQCHLESTTDLFKRGLNCYFKTISFHSGNKGTEINLTKYSSVNYNPLIQMPGLPWWLRWWRTCLQGGETWVWSWVGKIPWRREWQPTPVLLPGDTQGQRNLVGHRTWGRKELDMTEWVTLPFLLMPGLPQVFGDRL